MTRCRFLPRQAWRATATSLISWCTVPLEEASGIRGAAVAAVGSNQLALRSLVREEDANHRPAPRDVWPGRGEAPVRSVATLTCPFYALDWCPVIPPPHALPGPAEHRTFKTPSNKTIELTTIASNYHIEMNASDAVGDPARQRVEPTPLPGARRHPAATSQPLAFRPSPLSRYLHVCCRASTTAS